MNLESFKELKELIIASAQLYYEGHPKITDTAFDALVEKYIKMGGVDLPVGFGYRPTSTSFDHLIGEVGSLKKIHKENSVGAFPQSEVIQLTPKLDGCSAVAYYKLGKLWKVLSRGDGQAGIDITGNILHAIPQQITVLDPTAIRGEIVLTFEDFEKMEGSHPRNKATGLSQSCHSDLVDIQKLRFVAYEICTSSKSKLQHLSKLEEFGFETPFSFISTFEATQQMFETLIDQSHSFYTSKGDGKTYPCDGLVLTSTDREKRVEKSEIVQYFTKELAYKFEDVGVVTTIKDIEWNLSKTGRLVPVGILEPVEIDGATISRVTLDNWRRITTDQIGVNSVVNVIRANKIIPKVVDVIQTSCLTQQPTICPSCGTSVSTLGVDLVCTNLQCDRFIKYTIRTIFEAYKTDKGLSSATFEKFETEFRIQNLKDLQSILKCDKIYQSLLERFGDHYGDLLCRMVKALRSRKPTLQEILIFSNIPRLGSTSIKKIATEITPDQFIKKLQTNDLRSLEYLIATEPGVTGLLGTTLRITKILEFFNYKLTDLTQTTEEKNSGEIAVTGKLTKTKKELTAELTSKGYTLAKISKMSKGLIWDGLRESSQYLKAKKWGIPIYTEQEFFQR